MPRPHLNGLRAIRHKLLFIPLLQHQTYSPNKHTNFYRTSLEKKNRQRRYCNTSEIPNTGITSDIVWTVYHFAIYP